MLHKQNVRFPATERQHVRAVSIESEPRTNRIPIVEIEKDRLRSTGEWAVQSDNSVSPSDGCRPIPAGVDRWAGPDCDLTPSVMTQARRTGPHPDPGSGAKCSTCTTTQLFSGSAFPCSTISRLRNHVGGRFSLGSVGYSLVVDHGSPAGNGQVCLAAQGGHHRPLPAPPRYEREVQRHRDDGR